VPRVEAAHLRAAATHERAALLHEQAAELFDAMGLLSFAEQERVRARRDRDGAVAEHEHARLRHALIASRSKQHAAEHRSRPWDASPQG
jgi:hypothetical protein